MSTRIGLSVTPISRYACSFAETAAVAVAWLCSISRRTGIARPDHLVLTDVRAFGLWFSHFVKFLRRRATFARRIELSKYREGGQAFKWVLENHQIMIGRFGDHRWKITTGALCSILQWHGQLHPFVAASEKWTIILGVIQRELS